MPYPRRSPATAHDEVTLDISTGDVITDADQTDEVVELLVVDPNPTSLGFRFSIVNDAWQEYRVVMEHEGDDTLYGVKATEREGLVPVPNVWNKSGTWTAYLFRNGQVAHQLIFDAEISMATHDFETEIRFSTTEGPMGRMGEIRVSPFPRGLSPMFDSNVRDFAILVNFRNIPTSMPRGTTYTLEISNPNGDVVFTDDPPVAFIGGYRVRVDRTTVKASPGTWTVRVLLDGRAVARGQFEIQGDTNLETYMPDYTILAFEQFSVGM